MSERRKNIVIVCHYYVPHMGGIEIVVKNQAEQLAARGHNVTVITSRIGARAFRQRINNVTVLRLPALNILEKRGVPFPFFEPFSLLWTLIFTLRKADAVHIHDAVYMPCVVAAMVASLWRKPLFVTQHVDLVQHPSLFVMLVQKVLHALAGQLVYRTSSVVFTLNDRVAQHVVEHGAASHKLKNVVNGVDTSLFHPATSGEKQAVRQTFNLSATKPVVLFVGRFVPKKGFDKVLAAHSSSYQLVFAGGDARKSNDPNIIFLGKLPQSQLANLYRAADVFVLPSIGEGFPLSVQEAMATGLPIILADDKGYARYKLDRDLVCALPEATDQNVRMAIAELTANAGRRHRMGAYSRSYADQHFSWERITTQLETQYDSLPGGRS
ncbi:MAG TPA: glycosyltransferase family 4 protein [Candidatus Saccharimonas sp.]|nr:glycosyltransferase family 4 protein [Candidatus Saccharimonas sp.]